MEPPNTSTVGQLMRDDTNQKFADAVNRQAAILAKHLVHIFLVDEKQRRVPLGTGFLVTFNDGIFIVTAAHVVDNFSEKTPLSFATTVQPQEYELYGRVRKTRLEYGQSRNDDAFDMAVFRLDSDRMSDPKRLRSIAMSLERLAPDALPRQNKHYCAIGFPVAKSKVIQQTKSVSAGYFPLVSHSVPEKVYDDLALPPADHLLMPWSKKGVLSQDLRRMSRPSLVGMSGSPVWILYDHDGPNDPTATDVAGVLIEFRKNPDIIVVTDIGFAIEMIIEEWDDNHDIQ